MRRLARILLNAVTVLSVLLCLGTVALWARSRWAFHDCRCRWSGGSVHVGNATEGLAIYVDREPGTASHQGLYYYSARPFSLRRYFGEPDHDWPVQVWRMPVAVIPCTIVTIPYWMLAVATTLLPATRGLRHLRWRARRAVGLCSA